MTHLVEMRVVISGVHCTSAMVQSRSVVLCVHVPICPFFNGKNDDALLLLLLLVLLFRAVELCDWKKSEGGK